METALFYIAVIMFIIFAVGAIVVLLICLNIPREIDWTSEVDTTYYPDEDEIKDIDRI